MHHQIPTSSRDGATKTTAEDVLRCEAQIQTWGMRFVRGGWGCVSPPKYELRVCLLHSGNFDTLPPCQKHPPCSWHPIFSPRPVAPRLRPTGGCEHPMSRVPPLPSAPRSAPWRVQDEQEAVIMWSLRFMQHQKNNNKKQLKKGPSAWMNKFGFSSQTETPLRSVQIRRTFFRKLSTSYFDDFFFLLSSAFVRPAGPLAPENRHMCKESSWWTQRGRKTAPPDPQRPLRA